MPDQFYNYQQTLAKQLASYAYFQYSDDSDIVAFFTAYNQLSQQNLDAMNSLSLPNFFNKAGDLLDWVAKNIYGEVRHSLQTGTINSVGPLDTYPFDALRSNQYELVSNGDYFPVSDGVFKAILQWNIFKGDGYQFSIRWLKKRVKRFLNGNPFIQQTYDVSVTLSGTDVTITVPLSASYATALQAAVQSRTVLLPFQYNFTVDLV